MSNKKPPVAAAGRRLMPAPRMAGSRLFWLAEDVEEWLRTAPVPTWAAQKRT